MNFDTAFKLVIGHEGGYTANRADAGNWTGGKVGLGELKGTKYGIAANSYQKLDIKNLTLDQAKIIYKRDYWDRVKCDQLPQPLAFHVFDMAVNSGVSRGAKLLQRCVNVTQDGLIGPATLKALSGYDDATLVMLYNSERISFYTSLPTFSTFGKGWMNRVSSNLKLGVSK